MVTNHTVYLRLPTPLESLTFELPLDTLLNDVPVPGHLRDNTYLRTASAIPSPVTPLSALCNSQNPSFPITLDLCARLQGGKGGFGAQLRAAGGRMASGKNQNTDSCRDLSGRRLSTIKEAQRQAELLESAPALRAQAVAAEKAKLEGLERSLGITSSEAESSSSGSKRLADLDVEEVARKKHKFDDNAFLEESREINDNVRSAVSAGLLKKMKKKKAAAGAEAEKKDVKAAAGGSKDVEKDKIAMPPPVAAKAAIA